MKTRRIAWSVALTLGLVGPAWAGKTEQAAEYKAEAEGLLAKADFDGALAAYGNAARTDSGNTEYREAYAVLRRVIKMRESVAKETNPERIATLAAALRAFYYDHEIYGEALSLDESAFAREKSPEAAARLAETQLQLAQDARAEATIGQIEREQVTPDLQLLKAIAVARQGRTDDAKAILAGFEVPAEATPYVLYNLACANAQVGDADAALQWLVRTFENIPPSRLESFKTQASDDKDLASLTTHPGYAVAFKTESKIKESDCSGGTSCGNCPSRGKCGGGTATAAGGEKK